MHGLVAARVWLTLQDVTQLQEVRVTVRTVHPKLISLLQRAQAQGKGIRIADMLERCIVGVTRKTKALFEIDAKPGYIYECDGAKLHPLRKIRMHRFRLFLLKWRVTPARFVADMLDDAWITSRWQPQQSALNQVRFSTRCEIKLAPITKTGSMDQT